MIIEMADFKVAPEQQQAFVQTLQKAVTTVLSQSQGYRGHTIVSGIENPSRCVLTVHWDSVEDHTVGFRQSPAFADWRALIGPFFLAPPQVEHFAVVEQRPPV